MTFQPKSVLDTIEYTKWTSKVMTINDFSWTLKPSYYDHYLLRGDRVFLSLLQANKFQRDVYFTAAFMEESRLSLKDFLSAYIVVDKLSPSKKENLSFEAYKNLISSYLMLSKYINPNSQDELYLFDNLRYNLFQKVNDFIDVNEKAKAKELMKLLDSLAGEDKFPYSSSYGKEYDLYLRKRLK